MHLILHLLLYLSLGSATLILAGILFMKWLRYKERLMAFQLKQDNNKALAPLKITAYERLVVMLERISPQSVLMRQSNSSGNATMLQLELMRAIREEFEHNISLQMYVSMECWEKIKRAKEETTELIKIAFTKVRPEGPAMDLTKEILKLEATAGNSAIKDALLAIRIEMARYF